MSNEDPGDDGPRASRSVRLVLMGVGIAALLYSCTPGIGAAIGGWPGFGFLGNPFYRGSPYPVCGPNAPSTPECAANTRSGGSSGGSGFFGGGSSGTTSNAAASARGGFGGSASAHGAGGSS